MVQRYPVMVAKIAEVLAERDTEGNGYEVYIEDAISVLSVLMIPTFSMLAAGCEAHPIGDYNKDTTLGDIILAEWRAMLQRAVTDYGPGPEA